MQATTWFQMLHPKNSVSTAACSPFTEHAWTALLVEVSAFLFHTYGIVNGSDSSLFWNCISLCLHSRLCISTLCKWMTQHQSQSCSKPALIQSADAYVGFQLSNVLPLYAYGEEPHLGNYSETAVWQICCLCRTEMQDITEWRTHDHVLMNICICNS